MKYINQLSVTALLALSCWSCNKVEPLKMEVPTRERSYEQLASYRQSSHPTSLLWLSSWRADGGKASYLSNLPDSLDLVVLPEIPKTLTPSQEVDLKRARETKGYKVLLPLSLLQEVDRYTEAIDEGYDIVTADHPELDEEADKAKIDELIKAYEAEELAKLRKGFQQATEGVLALLGNGQFDGLALHTGELSDQQVKGAVSELISSLRQARPEAILLFEGPWSYVANRLKELSYVVDTTQEVASLGDLDKAYRRFVRFEGFSGEKLLLFSSMASEKWQTPFADLISASEKPLARLYSLALFRPEAGKGAPGLALRPDRNEESNGYPALRQAIQYLNNK